MKRNKRNNLELTTSGSNVELSEARSRAKNLQHLVLLCAILLLNACQTDSSENEGSMQPYDGYPMYTSIEECKQLLKKKCVDTIHFRKGEFIADIGAGNGYLEAILSMFHDSLTFYIQDIDAEVCNPEAVAKVVRHYEDLNKKAFTNTLTVVNGTDTSSNLPDNTFDKIMMLWTYTYFKDAETFMKDLRKKLKDDGRLYVINPEVDYEYAKTLTPKYGWNASTIETQISDIIEFGFELLKITRNYDDPEHPYIMVFKKKQ